MNVAHWAVIGLLMLGAGRDDPASLVEQLGAPRFADREQASRALEALGREALPLLREARNSKDPEVQTRATTLIDRIESKLMVRPTLVQLDFHDQPLPVVVKTLAERTGVPMALVPENSPVWPSRRVTIEAAEPVTFWQMLDRVAAAGQLQHNIGLGFAANGRSGVQFLAGNGAFREAL